MKLRSFYSILVGVVVGLLVLAAGGFYWLVSQSPLGLLKAGNDVTPAAAMFVPRQAPAMVSLLVNPDQLEAFRLAVAHPGERRKVRAELKQFKESLLANTGLNYEQDVQPWLGKELTLSLTTLDIDRDATNGRQPGYLLAIATRDPERSREFLQLFWQKRAIAGTDLVFEQYKGVKLIYGSKAEEIRSQKPAVGSQKNSKLNAQNSTFSYSLTPTPSLASAAVGDRFILFANHPKVLRDAINNVQASDLNLSNAGFYEQAIDSLTQPRIGLSFINLPGVAAWLSEETSTPIKDTKTSTSGKDKTKTSNSKRPSSKTEPLPERAPAEAKISPAYQTMAIALELDRHGLLAETALVGNNKASIPASLSQPVEALQFIPGSSSLSASGMNLDRLWSGLSNDLKSYETVSQLINQPLTELQNRWQIDLPKDVFSWVKGEYALGLVPSSVTQIEKQGKKEKKSNPSRPSSATSPTDWVFVAQRSDTSSAKQGIDRLDTIAKEQGLSVGPLKLGNQTISAWTRLTTGSAQKDASSPTLQAEVNGVHASIGNYEVFTTSIAAMDRVFKASESSLAKNNRFQQAIAPILQPNNGYLYLDWATSQPILENQFPLLKVVEALGKPIFSHLKSLTVSSYGNQSGVQRGGAFIRLL